MRKTKNPLKAESLRWQLLIRFFLILLLLIILMELSQYISMERYLYKSKEQLLESRIHNVDEQVLEDIQSTDLVRKSASLLISNMLDKNMSMVIIDSKGEIVEEDSKLEDLSEAPKLGKNQYIKLLNQKGNLEGYQLVKDLGGHENIVIWRKLGSIDSPSGLVQMSTPTDPIILVLHTQFYTYVVVSIIMLIAGGILVKHVLEHTLKPLYSMAGTVEKINIGQLDMRLPADNGQMEIDKLSEAFNNMLGRIEVSFEEEQYIKEKMRQFISDASHELRTPLTSIHGFVEVLLRGAAKNEKQLDMALKSILTESERLTKLVNDLLLLTKLDQRVSVEMKEENIKYIIDEMFPQLKILAGQRKIECKLENHIYAWVNKDQIKQIIFNLVHNATQYTDEKKGIISIDLSAMSIDEDIFAVLKISDNGAGIAEEDLNEIFDRFFRSESHRSRKHGGYGLGLSIVKSIVDSHGGKIEVNSKQGKGTAFTLYLRDRKEI